MSFIDPGKSIFDLGKIIAKAKLRDKILHDSAEVIAARHFEFREDLLKVL